METTTRFQADDSASTAVLPRADERGLRNQVAGETAICTVARSGAGLTYRGYEVRDLAEHASFEEVAYLLLLGELPTPEQLRSFRRELSWLRVLPQRLVDVLERIPSDAQPMDVMRTACSVLGCLEPETSQANPQLAAKRLIAVLPGALLYWYRFSRDRVRVDVESGAQTLAGHFLELLHDRSPRRLHARALDVSLICYAEHEFNASTFAARVCASTLSDLHSCVTAAIGTLRGALHGGANEVAMGLLDRFETPDEAVAAVGAMLDDGQRIMGFGHAVYDEVDPRNEIVRRWAGVLAAANGDRNLFAISRAIEREVWRRKRLPANAEFYHATAYRSLGIPTELYTPLFVCARVVGWIAHVLEQRTDNRVIRPRARYAGPSPRDVVPLRRRRADAPGRRSG